MTVMAEEPRAEEAELLRQIHQNWNSGSQAPALDLLRPLADDGRPWAVALMAWLTMQQGYPANQQCVPFALRAAQNGMPWAAVHAFNHLVGSVPNAPSLVDSLIELAQAGIPWTGGIDPVGQAWNLVGQGQPIAALRLLGLSALYPSTPAAWENLVNTARERASELEQLSEVARTTQSGLVAYAATAREVSIQSATV